MDPNATLAELRKYAAAGIPADTRRVQLQALDRMCELVQALDEWLTKGGFLPTDWSAKR